MGSLLWAGPQWRQEDKASDLHSRTRCVQKDKTHMSPQDLEPFVTQNPSGGALPASSVPPGKPL